LGSRDDEEEGDETAVESILWDTFASSLHYLFGHGHVGEATASDGTEEETGAWSDVEEAGDEWRCKIEAWVDKVSRGGK